MSDPPREKLQHLAHPPFSRAGRASEVSSSQTHGQAPKSLSRQLSLDKKSESAEAVLAEPSAKKQRLHGQSEKADGVRKEEAHSEGANTRPEPASESFASSVKVPDPRTEPHDQTSSPSPFPPRPGAAPSRKDGSGRKTNPKVQKREGVEARPYSLDPPKSAPAYPNNGRVALEAQDVGQRGQLTLRSGSSDFFPWTGTHPEDELSEQSIISGYYDKAPALQSELNSARPSLWSSVKHKSGVQILSALYVSVLDQRRDHTAVSPKSTFKPPPRATLTEAKRESWLKDLADPGVPLRRLSRTIPHGIRGRVLLDQSLAKHIPPWRTVWLAKCVGANEIRAFKRKGTGGAFASGGEAKWIQDWTISIEQFLEGLIQACGTPHWQHNVLYGYVGLAWSNIFLSG